MVCVGVDANLNIMVDDCGGDQLNAPGTVGSIPDIRTGNKGAGGQFSSRHGRRNTR